MFWADKFSQEIIESGKFKPYHVDDMKTPSGRIHVGALRGVIVHDLLYQALLKKKVKAEYTWVFNDMDPMDAFPSYLPEKFKQYLGQPLYKIPCPEKGYSSMARCYAEQFIRVFNQLGAHPRIIWSSEWYQQGKFNQAVRQALDQAALVRKLYHNVSGYDKPKTWYPYQVICPQCGKVGTTLVTGWDGKKVKFSCQENLVRWAKGCGYQGEIEPVNDKGKLMWKVDWAAHWKLIGVTIEGAGKDHMSKGGSHDLSSAICEQVFKYPTPFAFIYEWFLAKGGKKMSSSQGIGVSAAEISQRLPAELLRFLMIKTDHRRAIIFNPQDNRSIPNLFDEYDRYAQAYYREGPASRLGQIWQLSQVEAIPKEAVFLPRFSDVVNYSQQASVDLEKKFSEIKGAKLTQEDKQELEKRVKYAKIWLKTYAPEEEKVGVLSDKAKIKLTEKQKKFLKLVLQLIKQPGEDPEELQQALYQAAKKIGIANQDAFAAIYLSLTGKKYGPQAAWFLLSQKKPTIIKYLKKTIS